MIWLFAAFAHYLNKFLRTAVLRSTGKASKKTWKAAAFPVLLAVCMVSAVCVSQGQPAAVDDGFILMNGGTFEMGSWRSDDETLHAMAFCNEKSEAAVECFRKLIKQSGIAVVGKFSK